jgi:hypothetical protein
VSVLVPMSPEAYAQYLVAAVAGYAHQNITSGRWPAEGALERSGAEHEKLLPQGLATPDNYLFEIHDAEAGRSSVHCGSGSRIGAVLVLGSCLTFVSMSGTGVKATQRGHSRHSSRSRGASA